MTSATPLSSFQPANAIEDVRDLIGFEVDPADFPSHTIRYRHQRWAEGVGLGGLSDEAWIDHFGRFRPLPGAQPQPLALAYHGHQFGSYNPDIGDGRGFLFAQMKDATGRVLDFGTKGSGQTPFSRFGDGRLTLKGGVREVLAANMLEAQGVYTSKPFSMIETGEELARHDEPSPTRSSVLVRLSHSHIRFGTFQRLAHKGDAAGIGRLVEHCVATYWPEAGQGDMAQQAAALLECVSGATARMIASWMAAGFVHGVMNTDNMVVTGESFDYGPWRFLPHLDSDFVAAYFDQQGRYRFGQQPRIGLWNLTRLAESLTLVCEVPALEAVLNCYSDIYRVAFRDAIYKRLGVATGALDADLQSISALMAWLGDSQIAFEPFFFDWFGGAASQARAEAGPRAEHYKSDQFSAVKADLLNRDPVAPERLAHPLFGEESPPHLVIDTVEALWAPIAEADDWSVFDSLVNRIESLRCAYAHPSELCN